MISVSCPNRLLASLRKSKPSALLVMVLFLAIAITVQHGAVPVLADDWLALFRLSGQESMTGGHYVLWHIRLPRTLFAVLVGASLGLSGALTQGLFRNPLADPGLLGVSAGAACAAAITIVFFSGLDLPATTPWRTWLLPIMAFLGALSVCFTLDRAARWVTPGSTIGLLLTGIALNALAAAIIGLCTYLATDEQLRNLSFWTLGSLAGADWLSVILLGGLILFAWFHIQRLTCVMNALALGEAAATHVGVDVLRLRSQIIILVAVLAGFAVAWCGTIGFIGLIAPHLVRVLFGSDQRRVIPLSLVMGGLLLLIADTLARTVAIPAEIPVGIFTALLGGPFFLLLLRGAGSRIG